MAHAPTQRVVHHSKLELVDVLDDVELHGHGVFPDPPALVNTDSGVGIEAERDTNVQTYVAPTVIGSTEHLKHETSHELIAGLLRCRPDKGTETLHGRDLAVQPSLLQHVLFALCCALLEDLLDGLGRRGLWQEPCTV